MSISIREVRSSFAALTEVNTPFLNVARKSSKHTPYRKGASPVVSASPDRRKSTLTTAIDGGGESSGGARSEAAIGVEQQTAMQGLRSQSQIMATREGGGWGGVGSWVEETGGPIDDSAAVRDPAGIEHCKRYRISVKQVLKHVWLRHGYGGKGFPLCRHSPSRARQRYPRFASMRNIVAGDRSSSGC